MDRADAIFTLFIYIAPALMVMALAAWYSDRRLPMAERRPRWRIQLVQWIRRVAR